eukprot:Hpha_TRINITY_DN16518_c2_g4::TRINITY_DN16518_c2_g4_i1::g.134188::m.134188
MVRGGGGFGLLQVNQLGVHNMRGRTLARRLRGVLCGSTLGEAVGGCGLHRRVVTRRLAPGCLLHRRVRLRVRRRRRPLRRHRRSLFCPRGGRGVCRTVAVLVSKTKAQLRLLRGSRSGDAGSTSRVMIRHCAGARGVGAGELGVRVLLVEYRVTVRRRRFACLLRRTALHSRCLCQCLPQGVRVRCTRCSVGLPRGAGGLSLCRQRRCRSGDPVLLLCARPRLDRPGPGERLRLLRVGEDRTRVRQRHVTRSPLLLGSLDVTLCPSKCNRLVTFHRRRVRRHACLVRAHVCHSLGVSCGSVGAGGRCSRVDTEARGVRRHRRNLSAAVGGGIRVLVAQETVRRVILDDTHNGGYHSGGRKG